MSTSPLLIPTEKADTTEVTSDDMKEAIRDADSILDIQTGAATSGDLAAQSSRLQAIERIFSPSGPGLSPFIPNHRSMLLTYSTRSISKW